MQNANNEAIDQNSSRLSNLKALDFCIIFLFIFFQRNTTNKQNDQHVVAMLETPCTKPCRSWVSGRDAHGAGSDTAVKAQGSSREPGVPRVGHCRQRQTGFLGVFSWLKAHWPFSTAARCFHKNNPPRGRSEQEPAGGGRPGPRTPESPHSLPPPAAALLPALNTNTERMILEEN